MASDLAKYVNGLVGQHWRPELRGNCWGLVLKVQGDLFGRMVDPTSLRGQWEQSPLPTHGAIVLMAKLAAPSMPVHAGVCLILPGPLVLHVDEPAGVCLEELPQVQMRGWKPEFYVPK